MRGSRTALLFATLAALLGLALVFALSREGPTTTQVMAEAQSEGRPPGEGGGEPQELQRLAAEVERLSRELDRLRRTGGGRTEGHVLELPATASPGLRPDGPVEPAWYLQQYVASFVGGGEGAEYFRLAVDAFALQLVDEIGALVSEPGRPLALRRSLVAMLATARFMGDDRVIDALVEALATRSPETFLTLVIHALVTVADERALPRIETAVFVVPVSVRAAMIDAVVNLAGLRANRTLLRLIELSGDDATSALLIARLNASDLDAALDALRIGSQRPPSVRLAAAQKVREYPSPEFRAFVDEWRKVETDDRVRAALDASDEPKDVPPWDAMRATGPPNASADKDDPNAWATKLADDGLQWLELAYDPPIVATSARIFEVNSPGAVIELLARPRGGEWFSLWSGEDPTPQPGPFLVTFPETPFAVRDLRIVLDTDRRAGWNEVDAVELAGPNGSAYAVYARASSTYGQ